MAFWNRFFKKRAVSEAVAKRLTFKERIAALRYLPEFFRLVWKTSPVMTMANVLLRVGRSFLPLAILYTGKLIIDQVQWLSHAKGAHSNHHLWQIGRASCRERV